MYGKNPLIYIHEHKSPLAITLSAWEFLRTLDAPHQELMRRHGQLWGRIGSIPEEAPETVSGEQKWHYLRVQREYQFDRAYSAILETFPKLRNTHCLFANGFIEFKNPYPHHLRSFPPQNPQSPPA